MSDSRTAISYTDDSAYTENTASANQENVPVVSFTEESAAVEPQDGGIAVIPEETGSTQSGLSDTSFGESAGSGESEAGHAQKSGIRGRLAVWLFRSVIALSCGVFALTSGMGIYSLTRNIERGEILPKITGALLVTVFGRAERINTSQENESGILRETDTVIESLRTDTAESITEEIREIDLTLTNETPYSPDMNAVLRMPRAIPPADELYAEYGSDAPLVLLLHTHATEGYSDSSGSGYRTEDTSRSVVAIGNVIAEKLENAGINTVHCETLFDAEDFTMAYYNASLEIKRIISQYPSVSYIIDIHRDSIETADGEYYAPTALIEGVNAAQLMFVIGTDHGGSGHSTWENNLSLAARLQASISEDYPTLMRNINLRSASFNEQYTSGSLLLEVGSCASDFDEAALGAEIFADHLISEILGGR